MTENRIENLIDEWYDRLVKGHTVSGYTAANELRAATNPAQFMPPLSEWPEDATHAIADFTGIVTFLRWTKDDPFSGGAPPPSAFFGEYPWRIKIPLGIDWRTLKVSRAEREKWEEDDEANDLQ